ncbi:MAG: VTC domain-containing protein, partial [Myxococcaceae bacterium]
PDDIAPFLRGEEEAVAGAGAAISRDLLAGGPRPVVVTQCRRVAYASRRDDIRITFDHDLTYYAPEGPDPSDPTPCPLGTILAREANILVELKWQQVLPDWLAQLLADLRHRAEDRPPKFVVAMRHLLAHPGAEHASPRANAL